MRIGNQSYVRAPTKTRNESSKTNQKSKITIDMASIASEDENSEDSFSDYSQFSQAWDEDSRDRPPANEFGNLMGRTTSNLAINFFNRQIYGRFTKNPKQKTERVFSDIHPKCRFALSALIKDPETLNHIFMGFTQCGQYFLSYTEKIIEDIDHYFNTSYEYDIHLWRFIPKQKLKFVSKFRIFKHLKGPNVLDKVMFMQFPGDMHKVVCYGLLATNPDVVYITIFTLPSPKSCRHCHSTFSVEDESIHQGWCVKHGFIVHYMFSMSQPSPAFDPNISLAFPDHLVISTGHHIHILNITTIEPPKTNISFTTLVKDDEKLNPTAQTQTCPFNDTFSEVSESPSEHFGSSSIVDAILEDFSEYDLESSEGNKPFHELNISCEPLNVTGKSYHNTLVQNIVDPRLKRLQNTSKDYLFSVPQTSSQKTVEKKVDKKTAEKAYEFIEENEKYEKISLFRKKRLAEKKYEFSEDNSENIVPFNSLRRERRYFYRSQTRCIRSPDFNSLFLSPRSPGWRSPMQSPNSRNGQFSPSSTRNIYCTSIRNSPHHSKSPISPKEAARKFYVYSPSIDSDCSDSDSRLIMRTAANVAVSHGNNQSGLLIVDPKTEAPKWIKKVVRRYSNGDFENSSLLSGQSRDDYNIPIEIPLLVQNLTEQQFDVVPDFRVDQLTEMQLIVTQRSFDCEQFVQKRAQNLCSDAHLEFLHCEDYDIKIIYVCPVNGHIYCQAVIRIGARKMADPNRRREVFIATSLFTWSIANDRFDIIEPVDADKLVPLKNFKQTPQEKLSPVNCKNVVVMDFNYTTSKTYLRDPNNYYEICLGSATMPLIRSHFFLEESSSDSD